MSIYADMYPDEWTPPCQQEEQAAEGGSNTWSRNSMTNDTRRGFGPALKS